VAQLHDDDDDDDDSFRTLRIELQALSAPTNAMIYTLL
jgi:hypothetical protein